MRLLPCNDHLIFLDDGLILSTWNSITNFFYFTVGILGLYLTWKRSDSRNQNIHKSISYDFLCSNVCSDREIISLYVSIIIIGVCSTIYHSSLTIWSVSFDFFAIKMFNLLIMSILLPKLKSFTYSNAMFMSGYFILIMVGGFMMLLPNFGFLLYNIFVSFLMLGVIVIIHTHLKQFAKLSVKKTDNWKDDKVKNLRQAHYKQAHRWFITSVIFFIFAFTCYFIPRFACKEYKHIRVLQFHAFWHILSAAGLFSIVRCVSLIHDVFKQSPTSSCAKCGSDGLVVGLGTGPGGYHPEAEKR